MIEANFTITPMVFPVFITLFFFLALGTNAKEIKPVVYDLVACLSGHLLGQFARSGDVNIYDALALDANQVWVWVWVADVVAVAVVAEAKFSYFSHFLEHGYRFVNGSQTGHRKICLHALINLLCTRVFLIADQSLEHGHPLGGQAVASFSQSGSQFLQSGLGFDHGLLLAVHNPHRDDFGTSRVELDF
jgi:hypothetical protein